MIGGTMFSRMHGLPIANITLRQIPTPWVCAGKSSHIELH